MTRKRSKLRAKAKTKHRSGPKPRTRNRRLNVRKTQKGGANMSARTHMTGSPKMNALSLVFQHGLIRSASLSKLKIAIGKAGIIINRPDKEEIDADIDNEFSQGVEFPIESITKHIKKSVSLPLHRRNQRSSEPCSSISKIELDNLSRSLCEVEKQFNIFIARLFDEQYIEMAGRDNWNPEEPDPTLYRYFYQILTETHLKRMISTVIGGYDPSHPTQLSQEYQDSRYAQLIHSYMYKIFAGIATKYAMTNTVLNYSLPGPQPPGGGLGGLAAVLPPTVFVFGSGVPPIPPLPPLPPLPVNPPPFSEFRDLCLVMRDILGLINCLFRQELTHALQGTNRGINIGDTQYCHSGGNMFYVMAMMLCYIHTKHYPRGEYEPNPPPDPAYPTDILYEMMQAFDVALGDEIVCFYRYLHELMNNRDFKDLLHKITSSMSDLDFLCLTTVDDLLEDKNRIIMKDVTYLMGGILLEHCGIGLSNGPPDNIALKVILPDRKPKDVICGIFKTSIRSHVNNTISSQVNAILSPYLPPYLDLLNGIKLSTNKIDILQIYLIRIKVAMEQPKKCISDELRKIFAEKLDFVVGSMESAFYSYKQCKFKNCDYYSLETFIHELKDILSTSHDDKSDKRDIRYQFFNILSYIDKHKDKNLSVCSHDTIVKDVNIAIQIAKRKAKEAKREAMRIAKRKAKEAKREKGNAKVRRTNWSTENQDGDETLADSVGGTGEEDDDDPCEEAAAGQGEAAGEGAATLCWFNLLFGIIFQFLDHTTKNKSAQGCVVPCTDIYSFYNPPPPPAPPALPLGPTPNQTIALQRQRDAVLTSFQKTGMGVNWGQGDILNRALRVSGTEARVVSVVGAALARQIQTTLQLVMVIEPEPTRGRSPVRSTPASRGTTHRKSALAPNRSKKNNRMAAENNAPNEDEL